MKKDPRFFLGHIIDSVGDIESYLKNISHENFLKLKQQLTELLKYLDRKTPQLRIR